MKPEKVFVLPNPDKPAAMDAAGHIAEDLSSWGCKVQTVRSDCSLRECAAKDMPDLLVVLGGDGTIIDVARNTAGLNIPIVGVNFGTVGYMAEISHHRPEDLKKIADGRFSLQKRMMLDVVIIKEDGSVIEAASPVLNDAVLSNGPIPKLLEFDIYANGMPAYSMRSDGVIISTPTGSSAYSMSAGGPVMDPELSCICTTPICPHYLNDNRPTIFRGRTVIEVRNARCRGNNIYLSLDGREVHEIEGSDIIRVSRSSCTAPLVRVASDSFVRHLNTKLSYRPKEN